MLQLDVARLKRTPGESARYERQAYLTPLEVQGEKVSFSGPVRVCLVVSNTGDALLARGEVEGELKLTCSRCLEMFECAFNLPFEETYRPVAWGEEAATTGSGQEGVESVPFSGDFLDVTPEVLNNITLNLPMKALCREDCPGLCPHCGRNLKAGQCGCESEKVDPRLSVLKDFFGKKRD